MTCVAIVAGSIAYIVPKINIAEFLQEILKAIQLFKILIVVPHKSPDHYVLMITTRDWRKSSVLIEAVEVGWHPHRDSNADLKLRRFLFYPVKLWGHEVPL